MNALRLALILILLGACGCHGPGFPSQRPSGMNPTTATERQVTRDPRGHVLTNTGVWSPDGDWLVYDTRSERPGTNFDGETIEIVNARTGEVREVYRSTHGACCGVVTFHPRRPEVVFIHGPENPTPDWSYNAYHRQGVIVDTAHPGKPRPLDARDLSPPFTAGALRGGSHVHVWDATGDWLSFTYEDHVLAQFKEPSSTNDVNLRNIGVSVPGHAVRVSRDHPRNQDADYFTVLAARVVAEPRRGSDDIQKACEEGWVGTAGYIRNDGVRQRRALAFQGTVLDAQGVPCVEVFIVDLPGDLTRPGEGPLAGTETRAPFPPKGTRQRRLTYTTDRKYPGVQGPRHWLRTSPDGSRIAFLMRDDGGVVQLWTVSPNGGLPTQLTSNAWGISSCFTFSPDGRFIAHAMDNSVCVTEVATGKTRRLTPRSADASAPKAEACVFSPDGRQIAYLRPVASNGQTFNQVFVATLQP